MGGTGLEPVTPSLSSGFSGAGDPSLSPTFPAQRPFLLSMRGLVTRAVFESFVCFLCVDEPPILVF